MRLFGYRITGVSLKFFLLVGLLLVGIVAFMAFRPEPAPQRNLLYEPAFAPALIATQAAEDGWLGPYESSQDLKKPTSSVEFTGANFASNVGLPMLLQVYIPDPASFTPYTVNAYGKTFIPAYFINPTQPTSLTQLQGATNPADPSFMVIGFPSDSVPIPGKAYAVKGLMWWRSDLLVLNQGARAQALMQPNPAPVFLSDGFEELQPAQLRAPATHTVDLDLRYAENGQEVTVQRAEWAAGREVRLLVTLRNLTNAPMPIWEGVAATTGSLPGQASIPGQPDLESPLAQATQLESQQSVTGYILFDRAIANPEQELTLRMPSLSRMGTAQGAENDIIILRIAPNRLVSQTPAAWSAAPAPPVSG